VVNGEKLNMPKYTQRKRRKQRTTNRIQSSLVKPTIETEVRTNRYIPDSPGAAPRTFANELERHLQIRKELKTICAIGGILLVILIIAALVLR